MSGLRTKKLFFISYFIATYILFRLSYFSFSLGFLTSSIKDLVFWFTGAIIGGYFIKLEQIAYALYIYPQEPLSVQIKSLFKQKQYHQLLKTLKINVNLQRLAFRSVVFQAIWFVLAFFILTSTSYTFGKTMVIGIGLHLLLDQWADYLKGRGFAWSFWR